MKLSKKLKKIFSPAVFLVARYQARRLKRSFSRSFSLTTKELLRGVDLKKVSEIARQNEVPDAENLPHKYLNIERWMDISLDRVFSLGLDLEPKRRILDLGCGTGYFLYICKRLGHDVLGLDWPGCPPWFGEVLETIEVPRVVWTIKAFEPLPDLGEPFDFVTAFMICFNGHKSEDLWKVEEWRFFLDDLAKHLHPNAVVMLQLNPENGQYFTPELKRFFVERGAIVDRKRVIWGMKRRVFEALSNGDS